jgi:hypothetical protein
MSHSARTDVRAWWPACDEGYVSASDAPGHVLDTDARPAACSCGEIYAGSPSFVRDRHARHVRDELAANAKA